MRSMVEQTSPVKVTFTAMHGVGHAWTSRTFAAFNLPAYVQVKYAVPARGARVRCAR